MRPVKIGELKNGMKFYSQYDSRNNNVSGIGVKCGSIHDPPGCSGLAHLAEHVLSRESLRYGPGVVDSLIERYMGGPEGEGANIRIDRVSTFYGHGDLIRRSYMRDCFDMFASLLEDKIITKESIAIEKAAIHQEYYLRGLDLTENLVDDLMHQVMYDENPARKRIDCEPEQLAKISPNQLRRFVRKQYVPENMFAIVLGPQFESVKELAKRYFADWTGPSAPRLAYDHSEDWPSLKRIRSVEIQKPGMHQYHLALGFPTETYMSKDAEALDILARIWAFRLKSRLREENRDFNRGVYRALAFTPRSFCHGIIYCWFATKDCDFCKKGKEIALEEAKTLKQDLVNDGELYDMIKNLDFDYLDAFQDVAFMLSEGIINAVCNGDEDLSRLHSFRRRLYKVNRRKIRETANKYFALPNYAQVLIQPT